MPLRISVVIPAYNAESWLESTVAKLSVALGAAGIAEFEIIIVNDGSQDGTEKVAEQISQQPDLHARVLSHPNQGRYLTRKKGVLAAKYDTLLFIDTRVWIDEGALDFVKKQLDAHPDRLIWNGHINVAKAGNIIARFGDALTLIGWSRYFRKPRLTSFTHKDFDFYPKGTGLFFAPKEIINNAFEWFEANTADIKNSSDDTLLIRHIAESHRIWLSPEFSATYFARTTVRAFVKHTFYRGQFFVDGFLRKGTRFYYPLLGFLALSVPLLILVTLYPALLIGLAILWIGLFPAGLLLGLGAKDAAALSLLAPLFAVTYGLGIWTATVRRATHG